MIILYTLMPSLMATASASSVSSFSRVTASNPLFSAKVIIVSSCCLSVLCVWEVKGDEEKEEEEEEGEEGEEEDRRGREGRAGGVSIEYRAEESVKENKRPQVGGIRTSSAV